MTDGDDPDEYERNTTVREEVESDELMKSLKNAMKALKEAETTHETIDGPDDETRYILYRDRVPSGHYHELARTITEAVLKASPRDIARVGVQGIDDLLRARDEQAVETLLGNGISYIETAYNDGSIEGRCAATPTVVEAVLSLYIPGLMQAYFLDREGRAIAARFDDTVQYYWLSDDAYQQCGEQLESDLFSAIVTDEELEQIIERAHPDS